MIDIFPMTHAMTHAPCKQPLHRDGEEAVCRVVMLVPETGLEPVRGCPHRFLRPKRLPFRHSGFAYILT